MGGRLHPEGVQADFLECSRPTYIAIEKGERAAKSEEIIKLASFLARQVHELVRPTEPVVDLQPHLRAAVERLKGADDVALNAAIEELQRLAEDYRELERLMNAPLRWNHPPELILVNRKHPPERRRVSMLHEYGHLIVNRYEPGIDYLIIKGRKPAHERFAESFGLSFLMPTSSVRQRFNDIVNTTGDFKGADLRG